MAVGGSKAFGVLLDTHTWIWLRSGRLTAASEDLALLRQAAENASWYVLDFSLFEISYAVAKKRLTLDRSPFDWFLAALRHPGPQLLTITPELAAATVQLPEDFHGDPGDRLLAAAAISHHLTLCTHDANLLRFGKQGLFRTLKVNELRT